MYKRQAFEGVGFQQVVAVHEVDEFAPGTGDPCVAGLRKPFVGLGVEPDAVVSGGYAFEYGEAAVRRTVVDDDQVQALVRIPGAKLRIGAGQRRDEPRSRIVTRAYDVEPVARPRGTGFCRLVCRLVCRRQGFVVQKDVRDGEILAPQPPDAVEPDGEERQRTQRVGYEYATVELSRE